jgi:hypothetical protein
MMMWRSITLVSCVAGLLSLAWLTRATAIGQEQASEKKLLRHVVCFKFKETSSPEDIRRIEVAFSQLPQKIDAIRDYEWGTDNSPEGKAQGFTHCFLVTFADEQGRDEYLPHPAHQEFVKVVGPHVEKVFVIDYWAR